MKRALLIVDVQNDFLPGGSLAVNEGDKVIPVINRLMKLPFDYIIATKDWHPANHGSFACNHQKQVGEIIQLAGLEQILWPKHCIENTPGAEFAPTLNSHSIQKIFYKGVNPSLDSYSAFFDNSHKQSTGLNEFFKQEGVTDLVIAGLATDYCIKYSTHDALKLGYRITLVREGCRGVDLQPGDSQRALDELAAAGAKIVSVESL